MASAQFPPAVGDWYQFIGGNLFEIVALDEDDGTVELQHFDGTVEEMELEDWETRWYSGEIESADPPEDWTGSVDVEPEDEPASTWRSLS